MRTKCVLNSALNVANTPYLCNKLNKRTIMKYLFVALLFISTALFPSFIYAHKIPLFHKSNNESPTWSHKKKRSINDLPIIIQEDNTLYIHSGIPMEDATLTIKDEYNNVITSTTITILSNQGAVSILNLESGKYLLELESKESIYYGYFEIIK